MLASRAMPFPAVSVSAAEPPALRLLESVMLLVASNDTAVPALREAAYVAASAEEMMMSAGSTSQLPPRPARMRAPS